MMFFRNPLFNIIFTKIFLPLVLILFLILVVFLLREKLNENASEYRCRIKHFSLNWLLIAIYILGYFGLIIYLRIKYINSNTDIKPYIKKLTQFYQSTNIFHFVSNTIMIILMLLIVILFIALIHKFFTIQLIKRFLILHIKATMEFRVDFSNYLLLFKINHALDRLVFHTLDFFFNKVLKGKYNRLSNLLWQILFRITTHMIMTLPTIILYTWLLYDIKYNDLVISTAFYKYLLFYFIYFTYKRIHFFVDETDLSLNNILYRMYYLERSYWYVNIPQEYQEVISRYLNYGLSRNMTKYPEPLLDEVLGNYSLFMETKCCFYSDDGHQYSNGSKGFIEENNDRRDIIIDYNFLKNIGRKIKQNFNILLSMIILFLSSLETLLLLTIRYSANTIFYDILITISNLLLIFIPSITLFYCVWLILARVHHT